MNLARDIQETKPYFGVPANTPNFGLDRSREATPFPGVDRERDPLSRPASDEVSPLPARARRGWSRRMAGAPSVRFIKQEDGGVAIEIDRFTSYDEELEAMDMAPLEEIVHDMVAMFTAMSQGPLSLQELRARNHPYGMGKVVVVNGKLVRRGKLGRIGHARGVRGSVPNMSIVNKQSANGFASKWSGEVVKQDNGVKLKIENTSPVASYLCFGTTRMTSHGPWEYVTRHFLSRINSAWRRVVRQMWLRSQMDEHVGLMLGA